LTVFEKILSAYCQIDIKLYRDILKQSDHRQCISTLDWYSLNISGCIQITDQAFSNSAGKNALEIQRRWASRNSDHQHTQKYRTQERHDADDDCESKYHSLFLDDGFFTFYVDRSMNSISTLVPENTPLLHYRLTLTLVVKEPKWLHRQYESIRLDRYGSCSKSVDYYYFDEIQTGVCISINWRGCYPHEPF